MHLGMSIQNDVRWAVEHGNNLNNFKQQVGEGCLKLFMLFPIKRKE